MMPTTFTSLDDLRAAAGTHLGWTDWLDIMQDRVNLFADATGDHQWIHVDAARASTESPFKTTIAHGFLTLSLLSTLIRESMQFSGLRMAINYGLNRVRFISPVPSGARIRARITVHAVEEVAGGFQATWLVTIEREHSDKPACAAEWLVRYYPAK